MLILECLIQLIYGRVLSTIAIDSTFVTPDTLRLTVEVINETSKLWPFLYAGLGALSGALVGAIANFFFNRKLERQRAKESNRLFRKKALYEAYHRLQAALIGHSQALVDLYIKLDDIYKALPAEFSYFFERYTEILDLSIEELRVRNILSNEYTHHRIMLGELETAFIEFFNYLSEFDKVREEMSSEYRKASRGSHTAMLSKDIPLATKIHAVVKMGLQGAALSEDIGILLQNLVLSDITRRNLEERQPDEIAPLVLTKNGLKHQKS
jgi:hypothetical protein